VKKICPWLHRIEDSLAGESAVYMYLVVGDSAALLFDTTYGIAPIMPVIRRITNLPVICVLGHGHIDHANGAYQFEYAYIHNDDMELAMRHTGKKAKSIVLEGMEKRGISLPSDFNRNAYITSGCCNLKALDIGHIFDLGGLVLEVVHMEGHTKGSIGLLVKNKGVLLNSDGANPFMWLFLNESLPIADYVAMLKRSKMLDFDVFYTAHDEEGLPKELFCKFIKVAENANAADSKPFDKIPGLSGLVYKEDSAAIIFKP